jgi:hypothetical protein
LPPGKYTKKTIDLGGELGVKIEVLVDSKGNQYLSKNTTPYGQDSYSHNTYINDLDAKGIKHKLIKGQGYSTNLAGFYSTKL